MNHKISKNVYGLLSSWMVVLIFVAVGCQKVDTEVVDATSLTPTFDRNEDISFANLPSSIQEFHHHPNLPPETQEPLLTITWFPRPYPKFFNVLLLWEDGSIINYREVPDWAVQSRRMAKLNSGELQRGKSLLDNLIETQTPTTGNGSEVIALTFRFQDKSIFLTCTEMECPPEIQDLFKIAESAFERDAPSYGLMPSPFRNEY